jgi:hypothetical protein
MAISPESANQATVAWPSWARCAASLALIVHLLAILSGALAAPPASAAEGWLARRFAGYNQLLDLGYSYRFYVNGVPPTPIVLATIHSSDGTSTELRIPDRSLKPRLRFQRHLALAYHLRQESLRAPRDPDGNSQGRWAISYARHLASLHPNAMSVTLHLTDHLNPTPAELQSTAQSGKPSIDVEADRFYTAPEFVGEYPCRD